MPNEAKSETAPAKVCPLFLIGNLHAIEDAGCLGPDCMWWVVGGRCAVQLLGHYIPSIEDALQTISTDVHDSVEEKLR